MSKLRFVGSFVALSVALSQRSERRRQTRCLGFRTRTSSKIRAASRRPRGWTSSRLGATLISASGAGTRRQLGGSRTGAPRTTRSTPRRPSRGLKPGWYTLRAPGSSAARPKQHCYIELRCGSTQRARVLAGGVGRSVAPGRRSPPAAQLGCTDRTLHTDGLGGEWSNFDDDRARGRVRRELSVLGADVSSLTKSEDLRRAVLRRFQAPNALLGDDPSALDILRRTTAPIHLRVRSWVDPADGYHDLAEAREHGSTRARSRPESTGRSALLGHLGRSRAPVETGGVGQLLGRSSCGRPCIEHTYGRVPRHDRVRRGGPGHDADRQRAQRRHALARRSHLGSSELGQPGELPARPGTPP